MGKIKLLFILLLVLILTNCSATLFDEGDLSAAEKEEMISRIYYSIEKHWVFIDSLDIALDELENRLNQTLTNTGQEDFLWAVQDLLSDLNDGHLNLYWTPPGMQSYLPNAFFDYHNGSVVCMTDRDNSVFQAGDRIISINETNSQILFSNYVQLAYGSTARNKERKAVQMLFQTPEGASINVEYIRGTATNNTLLSYEERTISDELVISRRFDDIAYIRIKSLSYADIADEVDLAINELMDSSALIIDLRFNGGGESFNSDYIIGRFINETPDKFKMLDKSGNIKRKIGPFPRGPRYQGELALLTDCSTFSSANYIASMFREYDLGLIIGQSTGGGTGSPEIKLRFTSDIRFRVSSLETVSPGNISYERGVSPDITVDFSQAEIEAGLNSEWGNPSQDKTLQTALDSLRGLL